MKKIVGSLIAAVAIWGSTTAYVGSQMEGNLQKQINNTNELYADKGIQYKLKDYKKSFFDSSAKIEIEFTDPMLLEMAKDTIKLPLVMDYKIEHGPLFIKNGLGFGAAKIHQEVPLSSILTEHSKKELLSLIKDDVTITSDMIISFLKNANYTASVTEINIDEDGKSFHVTPLKLKGVMNLETLKGDNNLHIDTLEFKDSDNNGLTINKLLLDINIDEFIDKTLMLGGMDLSIEELKIKDNTNPQFNNINIATNIHMISKKDSADTISTHMEGSVNLKDTKLPAELPDLKTIHAKVNIDGIGTKGMLAFQKITQEMQTSQRELLAKMQSGTASNEEMQKVFEELGSLQETMLNKLVKTLNTFLIKDKTFITYGLDIETKDNKKSNASATVGYTGDMNFDAPLEEIAMKAQQHALEMLSLKVDIGLDAEHIKSLPNAEMLAQQIQMGVAQGFIKEENGKYLLKGQYKNQELIINDNNLTSTVLPLLMMATQGGGF